MRLLSAIRRPLIGTFWTGSTFGATKGLAFVAGIILARALPVGEFGRFVVLSTLAVVLIPVLDGGFPNVVFRAASCEPGGRRLELVRPATRPRLAYWSVMIVLLGGAGFLLRGATVGLEVVLVVLGAIGQAQLNAATADLQGRSAFASAGWVRTAPGLASLVGAGIVFILSDSAVAALASFALARLVPALVVTMIAWSHPREHGREDLSWRRALPLALLAILQVAYVRSDVLVMSLFHVPSESVAAYGAVYQWVIAGQLLPATMSTVVFPSLARRTPNSSRNYILAVEMSMFLTAAFAALTVWQSRHVFWLFGGEYSTATLPALPLAMTLLPVSISMISLHALIAVGRHRALVYVGLVGFVTNVSLNLLLVPIAGMRGALIATLCGESSVALSSLILAGRAGFRSLPKPVATLAAGAVAGALVAVVIGSIEVQRTTLMVALTAVAVGAFAAVSLAGRRLWRSDS